MGFMTHACRHLLLSVALAALLGSTTVTQADTGPVNIQPISFDSEGVHHAYRMFMEVQGEAMYWTVVQGPDVAEITPDEGYRSGLSGFDTLYTGPAFGDRAHKLHEGFGVLLPVISTEQSGTPFEYQDVFDNKQRVQDVRVAVHPTGENREIAGRKASGYSMAVVSEMSWRDGDGWEPYQLMNYGTIWIYEDLPFSPAPLQLSRGIFNFVFAPSVVDGLDHFYQQRLIEALKPLGMLAGARMQDFHVSEDTLETLEARDWRLDEEQSPGSARGMQFELLVTELTTDSAPLDYAVLDGLPKADGATVEYLESPVMVADMLQLCPPPPDDLPADELRAVMEEQATFRGEMSGFVDGPLLGEASFGSQDDSFGQGFVITAESYDEELEQAACLALLRVGAGMPKEGGSLSVLDDHGAAGQESGHMIAYLLLAELDGPGKISKVAVGLGQSGRIELESVAGGAMTGSLEVTGTFTALDDLTDSQPFEIRGEFNAQRVWDRVPTTR